MKLTVNQVAGLTKILQIFNAAINLYFSAFFLSEINRGLFYAISSIVAVQAIFELGFSNIILQYVSKYSKSDVSFNSIIKFNHKIYGFYKFVVKLYSRLALLLFIVINILSYYFFFDVAFNLELIISIILLGLSTSISFIFIPNLSFIEALGDQLEIWKFRLLQVSLNIVLLILFYKLNLNLLSYSLSILLSTVITLSLFLKKYLNVLLDIYKSKLITDFNYRTEIMPYQFKIAISWISGYFIYQIINLLVFKYQGPILAGKYGITLAVFGGIQGVALVFVNTSIPRWSKMLSYENYYRELFIDFKSIIQKSLLLVCLLCVILISVILIDERYTQLFYFKFLDFTSLLYLAIAYVLSLISFALASLIRCKLQEPFIKVSIIISILSSTGLYLGAKLNINLSLIFLVLMLLNLTLVLLIFKKEIRKWGN